MRITSDSGTSRRMIRVASIPFIRGMEMSMRTTSGLSDFVFSTASRPSTPSPHTSHPGCNNNKARSSRSTASLSSTRRIRTDTNHRPSLPFYSVTSIRRPNQPYREYETEVHKAFALAPYRFYLIDSAANGFEPWLFISIRPKFLFSLPESRRPWAKAIGSRLAPKIGSAND
jgi:hypothetical protein